jgi:hypothetical protein
MDGIYRSVNSYPHLATMTIPGNPEATSNEELAASARRVLDEMNANQLEEIRELWALRTGQERTLTDVVDVARAATQGRSIRCSLTSTKPCRARWTMKPVRLHSNRRARRTTAWWMRSPGEYGSTVAEC